jgi:hypothetical protein
MTTSFSIVARKVQFSTEGLSTHSLTRAAIQKRVRELETKTNLRPSSIETLNLYRQALELAKRNGL